MVNDHLPLPQKPQRYRRLPPVPPRMNPNYQAHLQQYCAHAPPLLNSGPQLSQTWHSTPQPPGILSCSDPNTSFQGPQRMIHVTPQRTKHHVQFQASGQPPTQEPLVPNFFTLSPTGKRIFSPEKSLDDMPDGLNVTHPTHGTLQGQLFNTRGGQHHLDAGASVP
ncbi:hypothetical protein H4Q26_010557 [Puccinia striiformis f. sp. tritici PST-130]|nr:hypothetical protein H4Q26_010557 [Puccinia striiformis f. sp. tritici PST-130]